MEKLFASSRPQMIIMIKLPQGILATNKMIVKIALIDIIEA